MWWLDEGPQAGVQPEGSPSTSQEQEFASRLRALQSLFEKPNPQQAEQLCSLRRQIRRLKQAVKQGEATCQALESKLAERDATHAELTAKLNQGRQDSEAAIRKRESRGARGIERCEAALRTLEQTVAKYESARRDLNIAMARRDSIHAAKFAQSELALRRAVLRVDEMTGQLILRDEEAATLKSHLETESKNREVAARELEQFRAAHAVQLERSYAAQQTAEQRCAELDNRRQTLECELEAALARADKESELRTVAEAELRRTCDECSRLHQQAEQARGEHQDLQRRSTERHNQLRREIARLRREVDDCERQLRQQDEQITRQKSELKLWQQQEQQARLETQQLAEQHAEQAAALEREVASLRSQVESERAARMHIDCEIQQVAEELTQQLTEERQQWLSSQRELTELQLELARRQQELDHSRDAAATAIDSQTAMKLQLEAQIAAHQTLQSELDATRSSAAEMEARKGGGAAELRTVLAGHAAELAANRRHIEQLEQQLQEAVQRSREEQESRERAERSNEPLTEEINLLRQRVDAFRGLAQREVAARRRLEAAVKRSGDNADPSTLAIRANIEVNERIRRLTSELAAVRAQELSVRQRAIQEIKRAHEELEQLKDQLARERDAA